MKIHFDGLLPINTKEYYSSKNYNIVDFEEADLYIPAGKGSVKKLKEHIEKDSSKLFGQIPGIEFLTAKHFLWIKNVSKIGFEKTLKFLPKTYVLKVEKDKNQFITRCNHYPFESFLLKSNQQKRKGIKIIKGSEVNSIDLEDYVVGQTILQTNKSISERAFHIRLYTIVSLIKGEFSFHLYNNGKFIYADKGSIITDRKIQPHQWEPKSFTELKDYSVQMDNLKTIFKTIHSNYKPLVGEYIDRINGYQLLGFDILIDSNNAIKIIEFNMRPEMSATSQEDEEMKTKILDDYYGLFQGKSLDENWVKV